MSQGYTAPFTFIYHPRTQGKGTTSTHSIPLLAGGKKGSLLFSELFIQKNKPMLFRQSFHRWKFPALSD